MTQKEKRITIAKLCGWTAIGMGYLEECTGFGDHLLIGHHGGPPQAIPDYLNSLDAMHEAEKLFLNDYEKQAHYWWVEMPKITGKQNNFNATASEKADAFLKTLGLI